MVLCQDQTIVMTKGFLPLSPQNPILLPLVGVTALRMHRLVVLSGNVLSGNGHREPSGVLAKFCFDLGGSNTNVSIFTNSADILSWPLKIGTLLYLCYTSTTKKLNNNGKEKKKPGSNFLPSLNCVFLYSIFRQTLPSWWQEGIVRVQILEILAATSTENINLLFFHHESKRSALILIGPKGVIWSYTFIWKSAFQCFVCQAWTYSIIFQLYLIPKPKKGCKCLEYKSLQSRYLWNEKSKGTRYRWDFYNHAAFTYKYIFY